MRKATVVAALILSLLVVLFAAYSNALQIAVGARLVQLAFIDS